MKRHIGLLLILIICGCSPELKDTSQKASQQEDSSISRSPEALAYDGTFTAPDDGFQIDFPLFPEITKTPANPAIAKITGAMYIVEDEESACGVIYSKFSAKRTDPSKELNAGRDNVIKALNATLVSDKDIKVDGHPGKEVILDLGDGSAQRIRFFMTEFELYQILFSSSLSEVSGEAADKFMTSFQLMQ